MILFFEINNEYSAIRRTLELQKPGGAKQVDVPKQVGKVMIFSLFTC
ncbi:MAG TPA: hypothetical protein VGC29_04115 [Flavisolibacter sp.]